MIEAAVLLAGGKSQRMGQDKARLPFGSEPLAARVYRTLAEVFPQVVVVTNQPDFPVPGAFCISDRFPGNGPLEGLASAFEAIDADRVLLVACDMPFLQPELLRALANEPDDADVIAPRTPRFREPLLAIYSRRLLPVLRERLGAGDCRVCGLIDDVNHREIGPEALRQHDPELRSFWNLNRPEDYEQALELLSR
ncbi:molybdenum cofactor guanylyltransferase [bacterium]|nr:molybdenum cofactor guanylyltransferase [bacterium]